MGKTTWNYNLSDSEKVLIKDNCDCNLISDIKGMDPKVLQEIYECISIPSEHRQFFNDVQNTWVSVFKYFYCMNKDLKEEDLYTKGSPYASDFLASNLHLQFRLYFAIRHPDKIEIKEITKNLETFLSDFDFALTPDKHVGQLISSESTPTQL